MGWIVSVVVATVIGIGALIVGRRLRNSLDRQTRRTGGVLATAIPIGALIVIAAQTLIAMVHQVPAGSIGVVYEFGAVKGQTGDGLHVIPPWRSLRTASVQVQRYRIERIDAFSKETQDVYIVATINYSISPRDVQSLYRNVGPNWFEKLVPARAVNFLKEETVKYETVNIAPNREAIRQEVRRRLAEELRAFSINLDDFLLDNIDFPDGFKRAIEEKQIATQNALREQARVQEERFKADQARERAIGEANAEIERARGEASAIRERGQALQQFPQVLQADFVRQLSNVQWGFLPAEAVTPFLPLPIPTAAPTPRP